MTNSQFDYRNLDPVDKRHAMWGAFCYNSPDVCAQFDAEREKQFRKIISTIVLELSGVQDIMDCAGGSVSGCAFTAAGLVPIAGKTKAGVKIGEAFVNVARHADDLPPGVPTSCALRSFSGDTEVLMADGTTKPIKDIRVGDLVLATDPQTGEEGPREVTHLWVHKDQLIDLRVDGGDLTTTEDHPFWNETDQQWQDSQALDPGDLLYTALGRTVAVTGLDWNSIQYGLAYNLTVDGIHTYYVLAGNTPVLVHNVGESCVVNQTLGAGAYAREGVGLVDGNINAPGVRDLVDEAGNAYGCHVCGATTSGTRSGGWIPDHQPATAAVAPGTPQTAYPHCLPCARQQGGIVRQLIGGNYEFS
ncbi:hypothetical protein HCJ94_27960 [Micromonospora sp. HSS6-12]|uniref:Hint domain-containing protein n=2 Tax=Micromonospora thermarum TaxID=2720024 RepID=A0ABX0ZEN8_9ACTN|nr:hypothetical protein [Micromonospora thermarum]